MPEAISGQHGHDTMFSVSCALVQGFSLDMANARILLAEYNATLTEPFSEREVDHKLQGAAQAQSTRGRGYLLNASDRTANIRVTLKKPANTPPQTVQRVGLGTLGTGISCMDMKNIKREDKKAIRESEPGVPPVPKKGGKPTLSPTGVLRIPMNAPIRYRYWLHGKHKDTHILNLKEIREELALPHLHSENTGHHGLKPA
jgi:hypothetical protein